MSGTRAQDKLTLYLTGVNIFIICDDCAIHANYTSACIII